MKREFVLQRAETDAVEFWTGLLTLLWGLSLLCDRQAFLTQQPFTGLLASIAPAWAWSLVSMAVGGLKLISLQRRHFEGRLGGAIIAAFAWSAVAGSFLVGSVVARKLSLMTPPFFVLAGMNCWVIIRLVVNRYETRDLPGDRGSFRIHRADHHRRSRLPAGADRRP